MIIGERLKAARKKMNVSAEELGIAAGVSRQQIARYEANQTDVTSDVLLKLAQHLDVTTDYLIGNSDIEHGYQSQSGSRSKIEIDRLIKLSPTTAARFVKALNIELEPNPLPIDIDHLLEIFPPNYVALFLKELGIPFEVKRSNGTESP